MKSRKKGFTIVEIVVALAVIAIISLATTTLVLTSQNAQKQSRDKFFAANFCNNSIAILQSAAKDAVDIDGMYGTFESEFESLLGVELGELTENETTIYFDGSWSQINTADGAKFKCVLSFTEGENKTVIFDIQINNNDDELYKTSYLTALGG